MIEKYKIWTKILPNIIGFFISLSAAYFLNWQAKDLVWSLWISSLLFGYTIFIIFTIKSMYANTKKMKFFIFSFMFFSIHFGIFHLVHATLLNDLIPIGFEISATDILTSPIHFINNVYHHLVIPYGFFVIAVFLAERQALLKVFRATEELAPNMMFYPYTNVIKMHIMLIVFGVIFKIFPENFIVVALVYFVYFVPIKEFKELKNHLKEKTI